MSEFTPIYCQEHCPYGKHCCFGEINIDSLGDRPIVERHKCKSAKKAEDKYVIVKVEKIA